MVYHGRTEIKIKDVYKLHQQKKEFVNIDQVSGIPYTLQSHLRLEEESWGDIGPGCCCYLFVFCLFCFSSCVKSSDIMSL